MYIHQILEKGTGADRQLNAYQKDEDMVSVVDYIRSQFLSGVV
jgi:carboxylate-amine ligase